MSEVTISTGVFVVVLIGLAYALGRFLGAAAQRDIWRPHMEKASAYAYAVDDLDRWCGHSSPHARLISRHLRAHGEGENRNAGTPVGDEACSIMGLREQLARLDGSGARRQGDSL
jgi:hypothetical protein